MRIVLFLSLIYLATAFVPTFKYGCNQTHCTYTFVMPEAVANYIKPEQLQVEMATLNNLIDTLAANVTDLSSSTVGTFNETFEIAYNNATEAVDFAVNSTETAAPLFQTSADSSSILVNNSEVVYNLTICLINANSQTDQTNCYIGNPVPGSVSPPPHLSENFEDE